MLQASFDGQFPHSPEIHGLVSVLDQQCRIMHPRIEQLVEQLQWHASIEGESLDAEYCESLNPEKILAKARRAGLLIDEARTGITHLRGAKIGCSADNEAPPLLTKSAFRLFSSALFAAFSQEVRPSNRATVSMES